MAKTQEEKIGDALLKVALGCSVEEVTEEYAEADGELKLTKRKKTRRDIPPDLKAVQMLLAEAGRSETAQMTDEELEKERERLISELKRSKLESVKKESKPRAKPRAKSRVKKKKTVAGTK